MGEAFGDRELDVMGVLWEQGTGTVAEVRERLNASLAYTTVLTILRNLEAKGFLRHEEVGKAHRYFPLVDREEASRSAVSRLIDKLFGGSAEMLITHLVGGQPLGEDELRRLQVLVEDRLGDGGKP